MSPSNGTFCTPPSTRSSMRPPSTTIWPLSTRTLVSIARRFVMMSDAADAEATCTLETSWKISSLTVPLSETCGRTRSVVPTSRRSMVWNGFTAAPAVPVAVN
jgi:hypothetical protein